MGANCVILSHTGQSCEVMPYSDIYDAITDVPVVTGATLWTSPHDGDEYILIFKEALWLGNTLQHTLVNPNQLRAYGTTIQDNSFASSPLKLDPPTGPTIPLTTMGTIIYCNTRVNSQLFLTYPFHPLPHGVHTMLSSQPIVWRGKSTSCRFHQFHQFPRLHTISPQQSMIQSPSIRDWFPQSKFTHPQNPLMNCLLRRHFKARAGIPQSHLKL